MHKIFLLMVLLSSSTSFGTIWTITDAGFTFSPSTLTITAGDTVDFTLGASHDALEVSQTTWNANGSSPLPGFSVPFGGGRVLPAQLGTGVHYYVCTAHVSMGMKGTIVVQSAIGTPEIYAQKRISIYPNPSSGKFTFELKGTQAPSISIVVYNSIGAEILSRTVGADDHDIDLSTQPSGIYIFKIRSGEMILCKRIVIE